MGIERVKEANVITFLVILRKKKKRMKIALNKTFPPTVLCPVVLIMDHIEILHL